MNDNQNHMVQKGRTTSRVLAPPGGQSSFSLGVAAPPPKKVPPKANKYTYTQEPAEVVAVPAAVKKDTPVPAAPVVAPVQVAPPAQAAQTQVPAAAQTQTQTQTQNKVLPTESMLPSSTGPISNNAFASSASMNGAQVMTGRSSSRVLAPPGGHTSWTLG